MTLPSITMGPLEFAVALAVVGDDGLPHDLARARVERDEVGIGRGDENLVLIDGDIAHGAGSAALRALGPDAIFPDQIAGAAVERLHDVAGIGQIDDAVVDERRGFVRSAARSSPTPRPA